MITLSLLHPIKQVPVQVWTFPNETTIRIGRSTDNQVILYSAVVSRHHVELRRVGSSWEIVSLGTNGTYLDGKRITQVPVTDGAVIRLARSGPNIQIRIGEEAVQQTPKTLEGDRTVGQRGEYPLVSTDITSRHIEGQDDVVELNEEPSGNSVIMGTIPVPPHLQLPPEAVTGIPASSMPAEKKAVPLAIAAKTLHTQTSITIPSRCTHARGGSVFCVDCGQPLQTLQTVGDYQLLRILGQGDVGITYQAWRTGQKLVVKTLNADWVHSSKARDALECEVETLQHLNHPKIPRFVDFFTVAEQPYLVMEMMPGQNLAQQIASDGPISPKRAIAWVLELCKVLEYLHTFTPPILHRSIKPSSLICQTSSHKADTIALVDFGAVKAMALGQAIATVGTNGYNAPEHLDINAKPVVDLYSLGPLLAYLLTGQNPIAFYANREQGYRFYAEFVPGISAEFADVLQTITDPRPERRYATAFALANALRSLRIK